MKTTYLLVTLAGILVVAACKREISEDKIRRTSTHALELSQKYVEQKEKDYGKELDTRISALGKDIDKLRDVSDPGKREAGSSINTSVDQLTAEKTRLEAMRKALADRSEGTHAALQTNWNRYNNEQDSILAGFDAFLQPYPLTNKEDKK